jgi:transcriptional regulator with XRE-family HTH domain
MNLHRGDILQFYKILHKIQTEELADRTNLSRRTIEQVLSGFRRGGPEFWDRVKNGIRIDVKEVDQLVDHIGEVGCDRFLKSLLKQDW